jgi:hypothetical protein
MSRRNLFLLGLGWLVWIWMLALISDRVAPWMSGPNGWSAEMQRRATPLARWDSGWYVGIAENGYETPSNPPGRETNHAFFPLYPLLMRLLSRLTGLETTLAGSLISGACLLLSLPLFAAWVKRRFGEGRVLPSTLVLLLFPTSLFFAAVYTESLLLLLVLLAVDLVERDRPVPATVAGYLAGLTRISGVVLAPFLFLVSLRESRSRGPLGPRAFLRATVLGGAPLAGFGTFCAYFLWKFGDPFLFVSAQHSWSPAPKTILDGPGLILRAVLDDFATGRIFHKSPARTLEGVILVAFAVLGFLLMRKRLFPEASYVLFSVAIVLFTGTLESAGRYVLPAFPAFAVFAALSDRSSIFFRSLLASSALVQAAYVFVFVHWLWVG